MTSEMETNIVAVERVKEYAETPQEVYIILWLENLEEERTRNSVAKTEQRFHGFLVPL